MDCPCRSDPLPIEKTGAASATQSALPSERDGTRLSRRTVLAGAASAAVTLVTEPLPARPARRRVMLATVSANYREGFEAIARQVERAVSGEDLACVAEHGGAIVAFFFLWNIRRPVPTLGIVIGDAWQDQGLGRQMLRLLLDEARSLGRAAVELTTMVHNDRAFHLYQRVGFRYVGRTTLHLGIGQTRVERRLVYPLTPASEAQFRHHRATP